MGRLPRERPRRLAQKLLQIRQALGFSQPQMLAALSLDKKVLSSAVSGYELGTREPSLLVLLKYARLAGVIMDVLVDDEVDLPSRFLNVRSSQSKSHRAVQKWGSSGNKKSR